MLTLYGQDTSPGTSTGGDHVTEQNHERDEIPETVIRDIHEMTSPPELPRLSPSRSIPYSDGASSGENFTTVSREFNALVIAGSSMENNNGNSQRNDQLTRIGENHDDDVAHHQEMNRWAIVPDGGTPVNNPATERSSGSQNRVGINGGGMMTTSTTSVQRVKREEVEAKITAWQTAKIAKVNNRFKRQDAVINGWLNEQVHKANSWMKKIERKLEERRAKAMEKTQNEVAKAQRKAEERRATAEGKRGTEVARVLEVANLMRALGRPPAKRSFFSFS